jgi:hypothetical protein
MALRAQPLPPAGFGRTLWRASRRKVLVMLVALTATVGASIGSALGGQPLDGSRVYLDAPQYVGGGVDELVRSHGCWTGAPPAGTTVPTHVVVSRDGGDPFYGGPRLTHQALDQLFRDRQHGLVVYAFCR